MKKTRTVRYAHSRREGRVKELTRTVECLVAKAKLWKISNIQAADDLTVQLLLVEKALERLL